MKDTCTRGTQGRWLCELDTVTWSLCMGVRSSVTAMAHETCRVTCYVAMYG